MLANISYKWGDMKMWSKVYQNRKTDWVFGVGGGGTWGLCSHQCQKQTYALALLTF